MKYNRDDYEECNCRDCTTYRALAKTDPAAVFIGLALLFLVCLFFIGSCTAEAATLGVEQGTGASVFSYSANDYSQSAVTLKTGEGLFTEYRIGTINGGPVFSVAKGLEMGETFKINASIGVAYLEAVPVELTGHGQFIVTLGAEYLINEDYSFNLNLRHFSNGSKIFGHGRVPNWGVEAVFLGIGKEF